MSTPEAGMQTYSLYDEPVLSKTFERKEARRRKSTTQMILTQYSSRSGTGLCVG
jgi:hypothetical protein